MGRRRFIRKMTALGISVASLGNISQKAAAAVSDNLKDEVPIPYLIKHTNHEGLIKGLEKGEPVPPERKTILKPVPRGQWERIQGAMNAAKVINKRIKRLANGSGLISAGVSTENTKTGKKKRIVVSYTKLKKRATGKTISPDIPRKEVVRKLPDTIDGKFKGEMAIQGIPVRIEERNLEEQANYDDRYRPVPGGCQVDETNGGKFTTGTPAYDYTVGTFRMVSAGHAVDSGNPVYQPTDSWWGGNRIGVGERDIAENYFDAGTIDPDGDVNIAYSLPGGWELIYGTLPWEEILRNEDDPTYELYLQGRTTGRNSGKIYDIDQTKFGIEVDSEGGDSGGPYFKKKMVISPISQGYTLGNRWGRSFCDGDGDN